jgi:hypothetical protein
MSSSLNSTASSTVRTSFDLKGKAFHFPDEQRNQVSQWTSIKIICENFQIINNELAILKPETNIILIHPIIFSFISKGNGYFAIGCFQSFKMKLIKIPNSIISLGNNCFRECSSLTQIFLPNSITSLGDNCFLGCLLLRQFNHPSSLKLIGNNIFVGCFQLSSQIKYKIVSN